ncbi:MAG: aldehyde-activating protein [Pseudomonadota bacterium]
MTGSCACGSVSVSTTRKPDFIHDCNCGLCRKVGAGWGYFVSEEVEVTGATNIFERPDKKVPTASVHFCPTCGTTTHFTPSAAQRAQQSCADYVGVNAKLFSPSELTGIEIRFPDGANWTGEGDFKYRRAALKVGEESPY